MEVENSPPARDPPQPYEKPKTRLNVCGLASKRKYSRRPKRGRKKHESNPKESSSNSGSEEKKLTSRNFRKKGRELVYLRPTNEPHLKAPKNSTQFIIDDHESSDVIIGGSSSNLPSSSQDLENSNMGDDEFFERDFKSVFESVHQEKIAEWDRQKICDEISSLEQKEKELVRVLSQVDPQSYLIHLKTQLASLKKINKLLQIEESQRCDQVLPDSSTNEADTQRQSRETVSSNSQQQNISSNSSENQENPSNSQENPETSPPQDQVV